MARGTPQSPDRDPPETAAIDIPSADTPSGAHAAAVRDLRAQFIAKVDELKALFDRAHDLLHDMQRK